MWASPLLLLLALRPVWGLATLGKTWFPGFQFVQFNTDILLLTIDFLKCSSFLKLDLEMIFRMFIGLYLIILGEYSFRLPLPLVSSIQ